MMLVMIRLQLCCWRDIWICCNLAELVFIDTGSLVQLKGTGRIFRRVHTMEAKKQDIIAEMRSELKLGIVSWIYL